MILYDLGIWLYRQGIRVASLAGNQKARLLNSGLNDVWDKLRRELDASGGYIWIHAASLGEFEQGRPLMEAIRREHPEKKILLTFFSPSGYEVRKNYAGADVVVYMPQDTPGNVRKFLDLAQPAMAIFVKYEFWLNYLKELKRREVPTYLISGIFRQDQTFFRSYGGWYRKALEAFTHLYVQDEGSRQLLSGIGVENVTVAGDTRFDRVTDIMRGVKPHPILDRFCGSAEERAKDKGCEERDLIFMVGSSWPEDEAVYADWLREASAVKGVIAPHEFDAERLRKLLALFDGSAVLMSDVEKNPALLADKRILIIDCFGLLSSAYSYADIAYVGGGFGAGLHNINEAAVYGIPVIFGPNNSKFIEAREMKDRGGGIEVRGKEEFGTEIDRLVRDDAFRLEKGARSGRYIRSKIGATEKILKDLGLI